MEEPGRLQSMGSQRVVHNWETSLVHWFSLQREKHFLFLFLCVCTRWWMVTKLTVVINSWCLKFKSLCCTLNLCLNKKKKKNRREERARRKEVNEGTHDSRASKHKASLGYWDRPETSCQSLHFPLGDVIKSPWNLGEGCLWVIQWFLNLLYISQSTWLSSLYLHFSNGGDLTWVEEGGGTLEQFCLKKTFLSFTQSLTSI